MAMIGDLRTASENPTELHIALFTSPAVANDCVIGFVVVAGDVDAHLQRLVKCLEVGRRSFTSVHFDHIFAEKSIDKFL